MQTTFDMQSCIQNLSSVLSCLNAYQSPGWETEPKLVDNIEPAANAEPANKVSDSASDAGLAPYGIEAPPTNTAAATPRVNIVIKSAFFSALAVSSFMPVISFRGTLIFSPIM